MVESGVVVLVFRSVFAVLGECGEVGGDLSDLGVGESACDEVHDVFRIGAGFHLGQFGYDFRRRFAGDPFEPSGGMALET